MRAKFIHHASALAILGLALVSAPCANASAITYLNESYGQPPTWDLNAWEFGAIDSLTREYVQEGVAGSGAVKMSGTFLEQYAGATIDLSQHGGVAGNMGATRENTMLTFDLKVGKPGLRYVIVYLQSWGGYVWDSFGSPWDPALPTSSVGVIPLGKYVPGVFKSISVPLNAPLWQVDPDYPGPLKGPFEPSGKTHQVFLMVVCEQPADVGEFSVTVDNLKLTTKTDMLEWKARGSGTVGETALTETGFAEHLGAYVETINIGIWDVNIQAANGDTLAGWLFPAAWDNEGNVVRVAVDIVDGTGRFKGAKGSYVADITWTAPDAYTAEAAGSITSVGATKK